MLKDYIKIAFGNMTHRKLRSWLTMIGIFIGIAAVVSLISLGQGLENVVVSQFNVAGPNIITIQASGTRDGPPGSGVVTPLTKKQRDKVAAVNGVDIAIGRLIATGKIEFNDKLNFGFVASMPGGKERKAVEDIANLKIIKGRMLRDGDTDSIIIGYGLQDNSKTKFFGKKLDVGTKILIENKQFTIVGVLDKKGSFTIDQAVLMNEEPMRETFNLPDNKYDIIVVRVKDVNRISNVEATIERVLRKERNVKEGEEDFTVQTSQAVINNLKSTLFAVQLFVYIIAGISIVVGGIGIMNTMYTAVLERTKEIGIMKSIGATNKTIFTLFFIESGFLGLVGGIIGIGLGVGIAAGLSAVARIILNSELLTAYFSLWVIFGALIFAFIVGTLAGVLPALQASRTNPVDALNFTK
ncbi:MAG: ABC transporter permease [Candidatus Woesearchaeota archaeon]